MIKAKKLTAVLLLIIVLVIIISITSKYTQLTGKAIGNQQQCFFIRGDADYNGRLDITDAITTLNYLFRGGTAPKCFDAADVDDSGSIEMTDPIRILRYLFQGGSSPIVPFPAQGIDTTPDSLTCNDLTDNYCSSMLTSNVCGYGKLSQSCICGNQYITEGYCCFGYYQNEPCRIQAFEQIKTTPEKIDLDVNLCIIKRSSIMENGIITHKFMGCGPYENEYDKEYKLTSSKVQQINPSYHNSEDKGVVVWQEPGGLYYCNLDINTKKPSNCENNKIKIGEGFNPSIDNQYIVWETKNTIEACDHTIKEDEPYSCSKDSKKIKITDKLKEDENITYQKFATPLIKDNYILFRDKTEVTNGFIYSLYLCKLVKIDKDYYCQYNNSIFAPIDTGIIDLQQPGDISAAGGIIYAKKIDGLYNIIYKESDKTTVIAERVDLISSPEIVSFRSNNNYLHYAVWKSAHPGIKYPTFVKSTSDPQFLYEVISSGHISASSSIVFCESPDYCFIADKILGPFEKSQYRPDKAAGNFINELFTCDLLPLTTPNDLRSNCLRKL